jgi:multiple sugar transport system substrate-binding protein
MLASTADPGGGLMRLRALVLAAVILTAPLGARSADLVVWWERGFYPQEDEAVREIIAAFEQQTGKEVALVQPAQDEFPDNIVATFGSGQPPDFAFGTNFDDYVAKWAFDDRLVDLSDAIGAFSDLFDPDVLNALTLPNARTGQKALYGLPIGRLTNYLHVWKSLLERARFALADIPRDWEAFWSFWCDEVQPAVREATGRDDIWGVGLSMSGEATDTWVQFRQFMAVYDAGYVTREGRVVLDDPEVRRRLIRAMDGYTAIYRQGCTPPDAVTWSNIDNNEDFLAQRVMMTANQTLSVPNALKLERPDDYHENVATIEWPLDPAGEPFPIVGFFIPAVVFKDGGHVATAEEFVRFLVAEG